MYKSFRRLLALLLLLTLPLQGLSAVLMPLHCLTDSEHAGMSADTNHHQSSAQEHDGNAHHPSPPHADKQGTASSNDAGHICCNHVYTGVPSVAVLTAPDTSFAAVTEVSNALPPFFPDRLLRPPRT
jgi:hypothetical protein